MAALEISDLGVATVSDQKHALLWCNQPFKQLAREAGQTPSALTEHLLGSGAKPADSTSDRNNIWIEHPSLGKLRACTTTIRSEGAPVTVVVVRLPGADERPSAPYRTCDLVTGLPDRRALERLLEQRFVEQGRPYALLFLDLNGFKNVNDTLGHAVGDRTLREVAGRFVDALRDVDTVARYGGDEFVVIAEGVASLEAVEPIVARLELAVAEPIPSAAGMAVSASIGVALSTDRYTSPEAMLNAADRRMYQNKRSGLPRADN